MQIFAFCLVLATAVSSAADLAGTWKLEQTGRNGQRRVTTYVFKTGGETFTGLVATPTEQREILHGVIRGNQIAFDTHFEFYEANRIDSYKGEINGEQLSILPANPPQGGRAATPIVLRKTSNETVYTPPQSWLALTNRFRLSSQLRRTGWRKRPLWAGTVGTSLPGESTMQRCAPSRTRWFPAACATRDTFM